jgi:hypothetical protein
VIMDIIILVLVWGSGSLITFEVMCWLIESGRSIYRLRPVGARKTDAADQKPQQSAKVEVDLTRGKVHVTLPFLQGSAYADMDLTAGQAEWFGSALLEAAKILAAREAR